MMDCSAYLEKHLMGVEFDENGKYCTGRFTGSCVKTLVEGFLAVSSCSFVRIASHCKGVSKRFKSDSSTKSAVFFSHTNSTVPIPYSGYPFEIVATEKWTCNETLAANKKYQEFSGPKKRKADGSCTASIQIRTARIYSEFGLPKDSSLSDAEIKKTKDAARKKLLEAFHSGKIVKSIDIHYCRFPLKSAHNHPYVTFRSNSTQLDKRVTNKIRELAKSGLYDIKSIKSMINDFVLNTIFAHAEESEKPKLDNKRYFPSTKAVRNHIFLAVGKVKNIPGYSISRNSCSEDIHPPSVTNILEIPSLQESRLNANERKRIGVGFVAVHAGAGYHSDERWPGYKHLCKSVCKDVTGQLKLGLPAGEAVTLAVKLLENSELTNAGYGSNLTENGKIECGASVMDTCPSPDLSNLCNSYFGSIACVSRVKNPVCAAYKILDEQRRRSRLELGRIPPSFLVGEGAENWSRAHGVEMCDEADLITESSHKSWQKYNRKLLQKLARTCADGNADEECMVKRMDTVGAVVLDLNGNIASAVSSGGLILKMPGRVGQAATYGCGCWTEPSGKNRPGVAVTTSGCGEQLVSTMLAKKCSENLRSQEQPYQALQDTLVRDFIGSPMLNTECDKQAGLLCLHQTMDDTQCTVEVVWGHTTSSMVVGHMSTNDENPKVVLSRLPDNATPGKSVTVGGSWTKVACSSETELHLSNTNSCEAEMPETNLEANYIRNQEVPSQALNPNEVACDNETVLHTCDGLSDTLSQEDHVDPDISVMFASPLPDGIPESMCVAEISQDYNRKVDEDFEKCINDRWEKRKAENPRLFNAQKFRIHSVVYKQEDGSPQFTFCLGLTNYRDYMETNWAKEVLQLKDNGDKLHGNSQAFLAEPLGVAAIVITDDHKVVFQWRNSWLAESAGMLDVPGGHPEPSDAAGVDSKKFVAFSDLKSENIVHEIFYSQMKEVRDELNVPMEKVGQTTLTGLIRNLQSGGRPVAYFYMRCFMTSEEILQSYNKGGAETDESTNLQFIEEGDIATLQRNQPELWKKMCPNGKAACTLYAMLKKKQQQAI